MDGGDEYEFQGGEVSIDAQNLKLNPGKDNQLSRTYLNMEEKIEKIMEVFGKRYNKCNPGFANKLQNSDSVLTLAFATMLLNTDIHKTDKKMSEKEFVSSLKGADEKRDFDKALLKNIYKAVKKEAFSSGVDHVAQTNLLQSSVVDLL